MHAFLFKFNGGLSGIIEYPDAYFKKNTPLDPSKFVYRAWRWISAPYFMDEKDDQNIQDVKFRLTLSMFMR